MFEDSIPYSRDDNMNYPNYEGILEFCSSEDTDWDSMWMYYPIEDYSIWKQKDGTKIPIKDMTTSHIKNCIKMIVRKEWREEWLSELLKELIKRKEL